MKSTGATLVLSIAVLLSAPSPGREGTPPAIQKYADSVMGDLKKMVGQDPNLMKDMGVTKPEELDSLKPSYDKAFVMKKVEAGKLEGAKHISDAISSTGLHYVPLCSGNRCPIMASFREGSANHPPEFESIGQPNLTRQIMETGARIRTNGAVASEGFEVVQFPEVQAGFFLGTGPGGEEVLIPQSDEEAKLLSAALNRPPSGTDGKGRPHFSLGDMRLIAKAASERNETFDDTPTAAISDPSEFDHDKPANTAGIFNPGSDDGTPKEGTPGSPERSKPASPAHKSADTGLVAHQAINPRLPVPAMETGRQASRLPQMGLGLLSLLLGGYLLRRRSRNST